MDRGLTIQFLDAARHVTGTLLKARPGGFEQDRMDAALVAGRIASGQGFNPDVGFAPGTLDA
jgi:hypothetical protein